MRAFVYFQEVEIIDFHLARMHGTRYCLVRFKDTGDCQNVPESCVEIRR